MRYSLIIPVFNRPDEVSELLQSLTTQRLMPHEVIIVEDGSSLPCAEVACRFANQLPIRYLTKTNGGPGPARNYGAAHATGDYLIILDSDCLLPADYLEAVEQELLREPADAFGGPDRAHPSFSPMQKAINTA